MLELLGVSSKKKRQALLDELYKYLGDFFEWTRQKEEKAIANKKTAKRRGQANPAELALQIFREIEENEPQLLRKYDPNFIDTKKSFDTFDLPEKGDAKVESNLFAKHGVAFKKGKKTLGFVETKLAAQDDLLALVANSGLRGLVRIPHEEDEIDRVFKKYSEFVKHLNKRINELTEERTADEDIQEKIRVSLTSLLPRRK